LPERHDVTFPSQGETCAAWHLVGQGDELSGERGRPCVVMAHGVGGTRDSGLLPYAEAFAEAGMDVVLFDYRCFGDSTGEPRQLGYPSRHRDDYRAAVAFARGIEGVDPERIALWGTSWSGGHVVYVAAGDPRIAAAIAQNPDLDGVRTVLEIARYADPRHLLRNTAESLKDLAAAARGNAPHFFPVAAPHGEVAALSSDEALPGYESIAGPTWRNEISARCLVYELFNRPIRKMAELPCPILIQTAEGDSIAPPEAAKAAAWRAKGRAEVREYPCNHFDIYTGEWRDRAIADQIHFLRRHLGAADASARLASTGAAS
jgi:pimeloyl-ACP methyl ester carboxylesterase